MKYFLFCLTFFAVHSGFAKEFQAIHSFQEVDLDHLSTESLVIFDVDEVLVTPADVLLKPIGGKFKGWEKVKPEQFENCLSVMLRATNYVLVDSKAPEIIEKLTKLKIPAMGFTSCRTGTFGVIESMQQWRFDQLEAVAISFSPFFREQYVFSELVDAHSNPPLFKNGILFCGDFYRSKKSTKGELLGIFLDRMNWKPEQVIFIDDEKKNLEAVQQELRKRSIPFQGYLFESSPPKLDEKIAQIQLQHVLEKKKWISDEEAKNGF